MLVTVAVARTVDVLVTWLAGVDSVVGLGELPLQEQTDEKRVPVQSDAKAGIAVA